MRPYLGPLALFLVLAAAPVARGQGVEPLAQPGGGPSGTGAVALSAGATAGLIGIGSLLASDDNNDAGLKPVGIALLVGGVLLGPSAGNVAVGGYGDAWIGAGLRVAGSAANVAGLAASLGSIGGGYSTAQNVGAGALFVGGAVLYVAGVGYDLVTASRNARRARAGRASGVAIGPGYDVATGTPTVALRVGL